MAISLTTWYNLRSSDCQSIKYCLFFFIISLIKNLDSLALYYKHSIPYKKNYHNLYNKMSLFQDFKIYFFRILSSLFLLKLGIIFEDTKKNKNNLNNVSVLRGF